MHSNDMSMSARFSWNQRNTGGHRPPLQENLAAIPSGVSPAVWHLDSREFWVKVDAQYAVHPDGPPGVRDHAGFQGRKRAIYARSTTGSGDPKDPYRTDPQIPAKR